MRADAGRRNPIVDGGGFVCFNLESQACVGDERFFCVPGPGGEFLEAESEDCGAEGLICASDGTDAECVVCRAESRRCQGNVPQECAADESAWNDLEPCDIEAGEACDNGRCVNLCDLAVSRRSYQGCEFYAADLDNASIAAGRDAASQQFAVVVSNPGGVETEVWVEVNDALFGEEPAVREVARLTVPPGDLEVLPLPRREVDGSSSRQQCFPDDRGCPGAEVCRCSRTPGGEDVSPCECLISMTADGINDGTHTAVTSNAYRIRSQLPIVAYQFNPLDNVGVFSNDASLLLPTSAVGTRYTVVGWPQTISDDPDVPSRDFDPGSEGEDLRATLTIVGTTPGTALSVELGALVNRVVGMGTPPIENDLFPRDRLNLSIGPFDVVNLETSGLNADFTQTLIESSHPVMVFSGSEASDAPRFDEYEFRQCCADHLEEQLFPDSVLGRRFIIGRMPSRSVALNNAFTTADSVPEGNEDEWVRIVSIDEGFTEIQTTLPPPDDQLILREHESAILRATQDMIITADKPVAVLQVLSSQERVGIPFEYPGGDPAIIAVPPVEQYRDNYVFLTPDLYAFDFVTITGPADATILLDGEQVTRALCDLGPASGIQPGPGDPPPDEVVWRCQLSFPDVRGTPNVLTTDGDQNDGVHTIIANDDVGIVVYGFDSFVSYAYAAGLNLETIN